MLSAGLRENEDASVAALHALNVLDSAPEREFEALVRAASLICGAPVAVISLIDTERQWLKANIGLVGMTEVPRATSFCAHTVLGDQVLEIPDATLDPRFFDNPAVLGPPNIRFYAGAPICLSNGHRVGSLCIIDHQVRRLDDTQREMLQCLALAVARALEGRAASLQLLQVTQQAQEQQRCLYEATPAMLHSIDPQGRLLAVSDLWLSKLRYTRAQVIGRPYTDFLSPSCREFARAVALPAFVASGRSDQVEYQMLSQDGTLLDVLVSATLELDATGLPVRSLAVVEDVTLRRRAERELLDERRRLANIIDATDVGTWEWNVRTGELRVNTRYAQFAGHTLGDPATDAPLLASDRDEHVHPDDRLRSERLLKQHFDQHSVRYACEMRLLHSDGHWVWVMDRGQVMSWGPDGAPEWMFGSRRDISERKQQEAALRKSEDLLDRTGRLARVGGWSLDLVNNELTWSDETRRIHGTAPDFQPVLADVIKFYPAEAQLLLQAAIARAIAAGEPWELELPFVRADGGKIWTRSVGTVEFEDGKATRLVGAVQDITESHDAKKALRELAAIFDSTTDFVVQTDNRGNIVYMNPSVRQATGFTADEPVTHLDYKGFYTPESVRLYAEVIMPALKAGASVWVGEATVYLAGQRAVPVSQIVIAHRDSQGRFERLSAVIRDIAAEVEVRRQVLLQAATLRSVTEAIPATVAVLGMDGTYRFVNGAFERWCGMPRKAIIGKPASLILGELEYRRRSPWMERAFAGETVNFVLDYPSEEGVSYVAFNYVPLRLDTGEVDSFVAVTQDITKQKREELRLLQMSLHDPLTDLLNRAGFEQHMNRVLQEGKGASLAVLYIDLDHFKPVNDQFGHPVGDQVLQIFAKRLIALVRASDAVARLGGDEFAIALTGTTEEANAQTVADKVLAIAHAPFKVGTLTIHIGASVGVAFDAHSHSGWQGLVQRADAELLAAKACGRGRQAGAAR